MIFHLGLFGNLRPPLDISSHFSSAIIGLKSGFHLTLNFFFCSHQHEMLKIRYFFLSTYGQAAASQLNNSGFEPSGQLRPFSVVFISVLFLHGGFFPSKVQRNAC